MIREDIYAALFNLVSAAPHLVTTSRKLKHWVDVSPSQRPALFQTQKHEAIMNSTGSPGKWMLEVDLYIYVSTAGAQHPGEVLNPILDFITAALANPFPGQPQTLGGLVHYARVEGVIETDEGTLGDDAVAIIPVKMLTTA
jgi:hypothetical protein